MNQNPKKFDVYAIGSAFVDRVVLVPDDILNQLGYRKGGIHLVTEETSAHINRQLNSYPSALFSGGSGGNTLTALKAMGGTGFYACRAGNDEKGQFYHNDLIKNGIASTHDFSSFQNGATSQCTILVTPDGERTLLSLLGASDQLLFCRLHEEALQAAKCLFIEGFLFLSDHSRKIVKLTHEAAHEHKLKTVLTLSTCLFPHELKSELMDTLHLGIDLIFCNEEEAFHFCETTDMNEVIVKLSQIVKQFIITQGDRGALFYDGDTCFNLPCVPTKIVDLTGAGDAFSGGFLYGFCKGLSFCEAGQLATKMAALVISQHGPRIKYLKSMS